MQYEEVAPISRQSAQRAFDSKNVHHICDALVRLAVHDTDWRWVQHACLRHLTHSNSEVRGAAVIGLGHLARIHRRLDLDLVIPEIKNLLTDPVIAGRVEDALDDIQIFLGDEDSRKPSQA